MLAIITARGIRVACSALLLWLSASHLLAGEWLLHPQDSMVGRLHTSQSRQQDTLLDIARRFDLGYNEIVAANPEVDIWLPGEGTEVVIPQLFVLPDVPWQGITLNLAERRLYYFPVLQGAQQSPRRVITYPVGIGREGWSTPTGKTRIVSKAAMPTWFPPQSIREEALRKGVVLPPRIGPGPDNPLGLYALGLAVPGYLLHGTNKPDGIGMRVSHGCIRLYPEDIKALFERVALDTPVWIIDQPDKAGWRGPLLYLESHPAGDVQGQLISDDHYLDEIWRVLGTESIEINWSLAEQVHRRADGVPTVIGRRLAPARDSRAGNEGEFE